MRAVKNVFFNKMFSTNILYRDKEQVVPRGRRRSRRVLEAKEAVAPEEVAFMGKEAAEVQGGEVEEEDIPAESAAESEEPAASSADDPAASSSADDQMPASSESSGPVDSSDAENPAASSESQGPGPESTASSMPDSLQSSSAQSSGPDGSSSDAYMRKIGLKKGAQSRYQMYLLCNMVEQAAKEMLKFARENAMERKDALRKREELLQALYYLRHMADVDDEFLTSEYEEEMKIIAQIRSKIRSMEAKEHDQHRDTDATSSSDDEIDGQNMAILCEARKMMEHAFGKEAKLPKELEDERSKLI